MPPQTASDGQPTSAAGHGVAYRIVRSMFVVLFFWMFWKFGGFLVNAVVGRVYGSGVESDAYFFATQTFVFGLIFSRAFKILVPAFTPVFIEQKDTRGERAAWDFASTVFNLTLVGCAAMMLVVYAYAEPITDTLVRGLSPEARALGIRLLKVIMPGAVMVVLFLPARCVLIGYKVFSYPSAAEAAQKLAWAVGLVATYKLLHLGIWSVAVGFLVGSACMLGVTTLGLRSRIGLYRPGFPGVSSARLAREALICAGFLAGAIAALTALSRLVGADSQYRDLMRMSVVLVVVVAFTGQLWLRARKRTSTIACFAALAAPLIVSTAFAAYRDVVTFYFQSFTSRGVFSDIEYARKIAFVPTTMVAYALGVAMFPYLCELAGKKDHKVLAGVLTKAIRMLALGFVPLTVMTVILADPVSRLVLDAGTRADIHVHYTALALAMLSLGLILYAWEFVVMQAYFSLQRMWTPALMGIAATFFQFAFLAVPIYALGYSYPVHIFFLAALAYPVSRAFKNVILIALLRRRLPILPVRDTAVFAAKLVVLSVAIGAATYFTHRAVRRALPLEPYRQHKVVVDNFEVGEDTWYSLNAKDLALVDGRAGGRAIRMRYDRHGDTPCSLYREMRGLRLSRDVRLEFACASGAPMAAIAVDVERDGKLTRVIEQDVTGAATDGRQTISCVIRDAQDVDRIHWLEAAPRGRGEGCLYLDDVRLVDESTGRRIWSQDFDSEGWQRVSDAGTGPATVADTQPDAEARRYALELAGDGARRLHKSLAGFDLAGAELVRCNIMGEADGKVTVKVTCDGHGASLDAGLSKPGKWEGVAVTWQELGFESVEQFQEAQEIGFEALGAAGQVWLDDITFRRPPRRMYEVAKLGHCAVPTVAGMIVGLVFLLLLRFPETQDVKQWVKARGWKKRKDVAQEADGGEVQP